MKKPLLKSPWFYLIGILLIGGIYFAYSLNARLNPSPRISDSPTTFIGFNHVGISVADLDKMLAFYQEATQYTLLKRTSIRDNADADKLFGKVGISYEKAILKGPNMLLELTEFGKQMDTLITKMPPQGPGMTHTCYQSQNTDSGYDKFKRAGAEILSRGDTAIDLGGYGVTYAYGYDPEGNMMELEQMSETIISLQIGKEYAKENPLWMTQVAIMSPDLPRLIEYYTKVLAIEPYRVGSYTDNPRFDDVVDQDNMGFDAAWFGMDTQGKKLELMQYLNPKTPPITTQKAVTDLGYSYSYEVLDIQKEYKRMQKLGVTFVSEPQLVEDFWQVYAHDIDGNVFSLRQAKDKQSIYSLKNF